MTINLTDPANHPANSPLTGERIERVIEALENSLKYRNGSTLDHVLADAVKGLRELRESREARPIHQVMYGELWRDITEEQYHDHAIHESPIRIVYAAPPAPVVPDTLPCPVFLEPGLKFGKGVRTQCMLDALNRRAEYHAELDAMTPEQRAEHDAGIAEFKAMLGGGFRDLSTPVDPQVAEYEEIIEQAIPDGYVLVPIEPTKEMIDAGWLHFMGTKNPSSKGTYKAMLAAAPKELG